MDHQIAYFDVRIFNHLLNPMPINPYRKHELDKKREYEERIQEVKHGSFALAPLVFSLAGGMSPIATTVYKRIVSLIADSDKNHILLHFFGCDAN